MLTAWKQLSAVLPDCLSRLPFPLADRYERWLLDHERRPLALLARVVEGRRFGQTVPLQWRVAMPVERGFDAATGKHQGSPDVGSRPPHWGSELLEKRVREAGRTCQWILRGDDGRGSAVESATGRAVADDDWDKSAFPQLTVRECWGDCDVESLLAQWVAWLAPRLLTLQELDDQTHARLESAACVRPLLVEDLYRLYPRIIDQETVNSARVEGRLHQAAG
jgi:hypothetical protein